MKTLLLFLALAMTGLVWAADNSVPPGVDPKNWVLITESYGYVITGRTGTNAVNPAATVEATNPPPATVPAPGPDAVSTNVAPARRVSAFQARPTVYGYYMIRQDGQWYRISPLTAPISTNGVRQIPLRSGGATPAF